MFPPQNSPTKFISEQKFLVATHDYGKEDKLGIGFVTSYIIEADGNLTKINTEATEGRGNSCVTFHNSGKYILVTRYWEGGISVLPFNDRTGEIGQICAGVIHQGSGKHPIRQASPHPHAIHGDPINDLVYVCDLGLDAVVQYKLDTSTGLLTLVSSKSMGEESGPRGMIFHPTKRIAYVNCELNGSLVVCKIDDEKGLEPIQTICAYPSDYSSGGNGSSKDRKRNTLSFDVSTEGGGLGKGRFWASEAVITFNGDYIYCICRVHQSIAVFKVLEDGKLLEHGRSNLLPHSNARNMTLDISGKYILVASQDVDQVECFAIDGESGLLERTDSQYAPCAADVAVV